MTIGTERPPCDAGVVHGGKAATPCAEDAKPWVLAATILGSSLAFILSSVVNVALPSMQRSLGASVVEMQWIVNAYMLLLGALILVGGSAGDRFGRRRMFVLGIVIFTLASVGCALAPDALTLILARGVQGVGGALLVPASLAIISATFPPKERGKAIGTWAGFSALTTAGGPLLGGWLVDVFSWRAVFWSVIPLAVLALAITLWRMPESRDDDGAARLDVWGALLAAVGLGAATYGLIASSELGWRHAAVWTSVVGGVLALGLFVYVEARSADPMMPLKLFRSRSFSGANLMSLLLYFALSGAFFFLPFNFIQVQGYSATLAGAAFLPFTLVMGGLSRWSGGLIDRYGAKKPLVVGPVVAGIGFALLAVPDVGSSYWTTFLPALLVLGFGMAVSVAPLTTVVMGAVADRYAGVASGINNAASRVAGLIAVAVLGAVAVGFFSEALDVRLAALDVRSETKDAVYAARQELAGATPPSEVSERDRRALEGAIRTSYVYSFRWIMLIAAGLAALSALCAAWMIEAGVEGKRGGERRNGGGRQKEA